jgi:hypothetical protein
VKLFFDTTSAARRCIDQITQAYQSSLLFLGFYDFCHFGFPVEKVVSSLLPELLWVCELAIKDWFPPDFFL